MKRKTASAIKEQLKPICAAHNIPEEVEASKEG